MNVFTCVCWDLGEKKRVCLKAHTVGCSSAPQTSRTGAVQAAKLSCILWEHLESWQEHRLGSLVSAVARFFFFPSMLLTAHLREMPPVTSAIIPVSAVWAGSTWGPSSAGDISWVHADR